MQGLQSLTSTSAQLCLYLLHMLGFCSRLLLENLGCWKRFESHFSSTTRFLTISVSPLHPHLSPRPSSLLPSPKYSMPSTFPGFELMLDSLLSVLCLAKCTCMLTLRLMTLFQELHPLCLLTCLQIRQKDLKVQKWCFSPPGEN